jgi:hypothetical protein
VPEASATLFANPSATNIEIVNMQGFEAKLPLSCIFSNKMAPFLCLLDAYNSIFRVVKGRLNTQWSDLDKAQ